MKTENWFAVEITADSVAAEAIEFALNEMDALGTEIDILGKKKEPEIMTIVGYFNEKTDEKFLQNQVTEALRIYNLPDDSVKQISEREVENKDWLEEWKKHWRPTETAKFIVAPMWSEVENTNKTIIRIEPSMAFGTGTHETTRLCLKAIEENYRPEMSLFDVGTGTGILAIAVAKIQSEFGSSESEIVGCDTDEDSIKIAEENAEINDSKKIKFYVGSILEETPEFDFVCANLTADVIIPLLPLLTKKFRRCLVLSGILKEQEDSIISELKRLKIENFQIETDGEWISILVIRGK